MLRGFNIKQFNAISGFLLDLSKILFVSSIVGFFIPGSAGNVNFPMFLFGSICTIVCFVFGVKLLAYDKNH